MRRRVHGSTRGFTDTESFQAYLDQRFPLGIIPRPLDPYWAIDDADYFPYLRSEENVTALDPQATLDIEPYWDPDTDAVLNACDNCPDHPNPGQEPVMFGQEILATALDTFAWSTPADVQFVRGGLGVVGGYGVDQLGVLLDATALKDAAVPAAGAGFYYLLRLGGSCSAGSWQTVLGEEPGRDLVLP